MLPERVSGGSDGVGCGPAGGPVVDGERGQSVGSAGSPASSGASRVLAGEDGRVGCDPEGSAVNGECGRPIGSPVSSASSAASRVLAGEEDGAACRIVGGDSVTLNADLTFSGTIAGRECSFLLDTGSSMNVLHRSVFDTMSGVTFHPTSTKAKTASQSDLRAVPCVIDLANRSLVMVSGESVRSVSVDRTSVASAVLGCDVSLPLGSECFVRGRVHHCDYDGEVLVEPCLSVPGVEVVRCVARVSDSSLPLLIRNMTTDSVTLSKHAEVADLEVSFVEEDMPETGAGTDSPVDVESLVNLEGSELLESQRRTLITVLQKHEAIFDGHIGHTDLVTHRIDTGDSPPSDRDPDEFPLI